MLHTRSLFWRVLILMAVVFVFTALLAGCAPATPATEMAEPATEAPAEEPTAAPTEEPMAEETQAAPEEPAETVEAMAPPEITTLPLHFQPGDVAFAPRYSPRELGIIHQPLQPTLSA